MTITKRVAQALLLVLLCMSSVCAFAQNDNPSNLTSSPYTRYGFGRLGTVGNSSTRAMGDIGIALRTNSFTNLYNPASLTAIDTLTMLFDTAIDAELYSMHENGANESDWNAGFSYMSFHFPLWNRFAGAIAYNPYSMVGYEYGNEVQKPIDNQLLGNDTLVYQNSYNGNGGLQHFQLALAWKPVKTKKHDLSLGATVGYICGRVNHAGSVYVSSGQSNSTFVNREFSAHGWDLNLGLQYTALLSARKSLTIGATFAPRTSINVNSSVLKYSSTDSIGDDIRNRLELSAPVKAGFGVAYSVDRKLLVSAEYSFENWNKVAGLDANMQQSDGVYKNISKFAAGIEYQPQTYAQNYFKTCRYRAGVNVRNSYIETYGSQNTEYTASVGIGLPVPKRRSVFNLSAAYTRVQPSKSGLMSEDYLHLTIGITFNEIMFFRSRLN